MKYSYPIENPMVVDSLWKWKEKVIPDNSIPIQDNSISCCECGIELDNEDIIESELWEDTYLCGSTECNNKHYRKDGGSG